MWVLSEIFFSEEGESFLAKGEIEGDDETFYMHVLWCYMPTTANITYGRHHLGVVVLPYKVMNIEIMNQNGSTLTITINGIISWVLNCVLTVIDGSLTFDCQKLNSDDFAWYKPLCHK